MSGRKQHQTIARDNLLVDVIWQHRGRHNAISTRKLATILTENGYKTSAESIHGIVAKVTLKRHLPVCSICQKGYFLAASKQDIYEAINDLEKKISGLQKRVDLLRNFIYED